MSLHNGQFCIIRIAYISNVIDLVEITKKPIDYCFVIYSKSCLKPPHKRIPKLVIKTDYPLMQVKGIAESSKGGSILQYFQPSLSYHLFLRHLLCLLLSGRISQVLQYLPARFCYCHMFAIFCHLNCTKICIL